MPRTRITQQDLEYACARLNRVSGNPEDGWTARSDGSMEARIGHFYIEAAYGGWKLVQTVNVFGGVRDALGGGYTSRRVLLGLIHAMIAGVNEANLRAEAEADAAEAQQDTEIRNCMI